jgi:hypothetical protein
VLGREGELEAAGRLIGEPSSRLLVRLRVKSGAFPIPPLLAHLLKRLVRFSRKPLSCVGGVRSLVRPGTRLIRRMSPSSVALRSGAVVCAWRRPSRSSERPCVSKWAGSTSSNGGGWLRRFYRDGISGLAISVRSIPLASDIGASARRVRRPKSAACAAKNNEVDRRRACQSALKIPASKLLPVFQGRRSDECP